MPEMTVHAPSIMDPRGRFHTQPMPLAPRLPALTGKRLLLFDNGKLSQRSTHNAVIFHTVAQRMREQYGVRECLRLHHDLLPMRVASVRGLARQIVRMGADAVILALCDAGVTAYTIVLAWELERQGLPTVSLCSGQSLELAAAMTLTVMPGLPLSQLNLFRHSAAAEIAAEALWVLGEVVDGLTTDPATLQRQFLETFAPQRDVLPTDAAGDLQIWEPQHLTLTETSSPALLLDPSAYAAELYDRLCQVGIGDGLPVIPPTRERVNAMLTYCDWAPEDIVVPRCFPSGLPLNVGTIAVNAVLAGCRPEYFPILLTAMQAVAEPRYRLPQAAVTSHPAGNAIIVSGPLAQEIGLASGGGCLGPGFRANATIGRALNLSLRHVGRAIPGQSDLSTMGSPAEWTFCWAEQTQGSPWTPLHVEHFDAETTSVTVLKCEGPHNVVDRLSRTAAGLLRGIADVAATLGGNNAYVPAELLVLLNPEQVQMIHSDGWSKADVQRYLYEHARNPRHLLAGRGVVPAHIPEFESLADIPVVRRPEDVLIVVAGTTGPHAMVGIPWGYAPAVTKAVTRRDGTPLRCLADCGAPAST